jgi:hypothetical protein
MASPLYNSRGTWSATVQYNYLDSVQYGKYKYICTANSGSLNQRPDQNLVWVQMPVIVQEDQYYLRSREDLLQYEDARYQSLVNAMANFYTTRNDQSVWGSFLRAVAIELARIEYMYSYDVVTKDSQFLTPPDIKRQYADPLFVTASFQQVSQFDSGDFGASFGQWSKDTGIILRTAILDSNGNIQVATTAGATGTADPSWALTTGATTSDGSVVWANAGPAPSTLAYPVGYRDMLVDLLAAYQEGATVNSIQDVIYAYTGKKIVVEELYKQIVTGGFYDQSDRNAIKVSVNVGGSDPLTDISSLTELQQITNSLYGAIDLAKPAHVGLEFTTVFGADENIDCFISPRFLTQYQLNTLTASQKRYYNLIAYVLVQPVVTAWKANTVFAANSIIQDTNGNIQLTVTGGITGATTPTWNSAHEGATTEYDSASPPAALITWVNVGTQRITIAAYNALPTAQKALYQGYYQDLNCVGTGIDDTLRIIIQQYEEPPFDPMLYQAPIFDPKNPTTTLAAYGRRLLAPLSPTNWTTLTTTPQVWGIGGTYSKGDLVRGRAYPTANSWSLYRAVKKNGVGTSAGARDPLTNPTYWSLLPSPSVYQAYYLSNGQYVLGIRQWIKSTAFYTGQFMFDNNGNLQIASTGGTTSPVATIDTSKPDGVSINNNNLLTLKVVSTVGMGLQITDTQNPSLLTLLGFTYAAFLNGLTLPVTDFGPDYITMAYTHTAYTTALHAETFAVIQTGFNATTNKLSYDGSVVWKNLGLNYLTDPSKWIAVVDSNNNVTGEVANWDVTHPMGLLAPRTDLVWEISGGDTFNSYEME